MLKVVFFCHSVLSDSPVLHAEPDLFYRINLVSFQLAMNRVTHGGHSGLGEGPGVLIFPLQPAFFTYFMQYSSAKDCCQVY